MDLLNELGPEASKFMNYAPDDLMHLSPLGAVYHAQLVVNAFAGQSRPYMIGIFDPPPKPRRRVWQTGAGELEKRGRRWLCRGPIIMKLPASTLASSNLIRRVRWRSLCHTVRFLRGRDFIRQRPGGGEILLQGQKMSRTVRSYFFFEANAAKLSDRSVA